MNVYQLAEQLGCAPDDALTLVRHVGPRGVVRTGDRRFLIPTAAVERLRLTRAVGVQPSARRTSPATHSGAGPGNGT